MTFMKSADLISIIVPIYKVELYLDRCVQSIIDQTYKNLEIILVDDGSTDNCPAMCDAWAERDSRIKVIHKTNGGLSDARNAGMAVASGTYIAFVDSDDWIHLRFIEFLSEAIQKTGAQLAACDIKETDSLSEPDVIDDKPSFVLYTQDGAMSSLARGETFRAVAWNKLYQKDLLINETFPIGKYHEDEFFTYRIIDKCSTLVFVDYPLYYYYQRGGSIMSENSIRHIDVLEAYCERQTLFREKYPSLYLQDKVMFCEACLNMYSGLTERNAQEREVAKKKVRNYRRRVHFSMKEIIQCSLKQRIYIVGSMPMLINFFSKSRNYKHRRNNELQR